MDPIVQAELLANEEHCTSLNVMILVDTINSERNVALCSVRQTSRHLGWRVYSTMQLLGRAEWALAPLLKLGITPMLSVYGWPGRTVAILDRAWWSRIFGMDWIRFPWRLMGFPGDDQRHGGDHQRQCMDPFGLEKAMTTSGI